MKCPSCKYEKRTKSFFTDKVVRFKSGKRKGEIKEIEKEKITVYENDPDFVHLFFEKDVDQLVFLEADSFYPARERATLFACPMCGTVIVEEINEGI